MPLPMRQAPCGVRARVPGHGAALLASVLCVLPSAGLVGCGSDSTPEASSSAPSAPATVPATVPPAPGGGTATAPTPTDALPEPVPPASWNTTLGELTVDGVTVRDVSATCGMFAMMPVVQVIAGATASCADRAGVTVAASFEGGQLRAVSVTGAGADCVRRAVVAASTGVSCQFQLTFGG